MSRLPDILSPASIPAGLERESQLWHHFECTELDPLLTPATRRNTLYLPTGLRAGSAWAVASDGRTYRTPDDLARFEWFDLDGDGVLETPHLVVEDAETQLVQHADVLSAWTSNFTVSAVPGHALGEANTFLVSDTDATNASYMSKVLGAFTGSTAKGVRIVWAAGTSPAASGAWARLRDTTAGVDRLNITVTANANGSPNVVVVGGAGVAHTSRFLRAEGGVRYYALHLTSNAITAANAHELRLGAAVTGTQTGNVYWGAVTVTDEPRVASWIDRPSTGAVSRAKEVLGWVAPNIPTTAHAQLVDLVEVGATAVSGAVLAALTDVNGANPSVVLGANASGRYMITHHNGTSSVSSSATVSPAMLDRVRLLAWYFDDGSVQIGQSINGGAMAFGTRSAALAPASAWGASAASRGFWLQPNAGLTKAKTRLQRWKIGGTALTEAQLVNRW